MTKTYKSDKQKSSPPTDVVFSLMVSMCCTLTVGRPIGFHGGRSDGVVVVERMRRSCRLQDLVARRRGQLDGGEIGGRRQCCGEGRELQSGDREREACYARYNWLVGRW